MDQAIIEYEKWVVDMECFALVQRTGRTFRVGSEFVALFPITVLAEAIWRTPFTIRRWERAGQFPKPMWQLPRDKCKRWYSKAQIEAIAQEHRRLSLGDYGFAHSRHFPISDFFKNVARMFHKVDAAMVLASKNKSVANQG